MSVNVEHPSMKFAGKGQVGARDRRGLDRDMTPELRREIITTYMRTLEQMNGSTGIESDLPYPKELIGRAIVRELIENPESDPKTLEIAYVQLESFLPFDEFRTLADFKDASRIAQEIADTGDPTSILKSAGIMRRAGGDRAVGIQEKISKKMRERLGQIQQLIAGSEHGKCGPTWFREACPCP